MVCIFCNIAVCSHKICTISAQDITWACWIVG
jgi:hypothetical protein